MSGFPGFTLQRHLSWNSSQQEAYSYSTDNVADQALTSCDEKETGFTYRKAIWPEGFNGQKCKEVHIIDCSPQMPWTGQTTFTQSV